MSKLPLHHCRAGRLMLAWRRSDDGLWTHDGRVLPWLWLGIGEPTGMGGLRLKVGPWMTAMAWLPVRAAQ